MVCNREPFHKAYCALCDHFTCELRFSLTWERERVLSSKCIHSAICISFHFRYLDLEQIKTFGQKRQLLLRYLALNIDFVFADQCGTLFVDRVLTFSRCVLTYLLLSKSLILDVMWAIKVWFLLDLIGSF